ncbi:MAG: acireductone synthase, partial [Lysobacteraceae bacterium]
DIGGVVSDDCIVELLQGWIDEDRKHTALKALQGMVWRDGYERGDYRAHFYADAAESLRHWHADGHPLYVYSSGSVPAQKLFFGYSEAGDLTPLVSGWFDTEIGHKRDADSYRRITNAIGRAPGDILFLSDVVEELDAAREAGLRTALLDRRGDYPQPREGDDCHDHTRFESFADIHA